MPLTRVAEDGTDSLTRSPSRCSDLRRMNLAPDDVATHNHSSRTTTAPCGPAPKADRDDVADQRSIERSPGLPPLVERGPVMDLGGYATCPETTRDTFRTGGLACYR